MPNLASSNAVLALAQADDLAMETVAVNMPGTGKDRPNWRPSSACLCKLYSRLDRPRRSPKRSGATAKPRAG
ncbi:MAG: hypothetical protein WBG11_09630 [Methylocella sp.]